MSDPFTAEIRILPYVFAPRGWASCDGQYIPINQNPALFSLIGTVYGGDGHTVFQLPNLKGCAPLHPGTGIGLTPRLLGRFGGEYTVSLSESHLPEHAHAGRAERHPVETTDPTDSLFGFVSNSRYWSDDTADLYQADFSALEVTGQSQGHQNMQPYLPLQFCICFDGLYPSRN